MKTPPKAPAWILGAGAIATADFRAGLLVATVGVAYTLISGIQELYRGRSQSNAIVSCLQNTSPSTTLEVEAIGEPRMRLEISSGTPPVLDEGTDCRVEAAREGSSE